VIVSRDNQGVDFKRERKREREREKRLGKERRIYKMNYKRR